jgi:hypothetical protein
MKAGGRWEIKWPGFGGENCRIELGCARFGFRGGQAADHPAEVVIGDERAMRGNELCRAFPIQRKDSSRARETGGHLARGRGLKGISGQHPKQGLIRLPSLLCRNDRVGSIGFRLEVAEEETYDISQDRRQRAVATGAGDPLEAGLGRNRIHRVGVERGRRRRWWNRRCCTSCRCSRAGGIEEGVEAAGFDDRVSRAVEGKHV